MYHSDLRCCELFFYNLSILKKQFKNENLRSLSLCANIYSTRYAIVNSKRIEECRTLLKIKFGRFSCFHSRESSLLIATLMSLELYPEKQLNNIAEVFYELKQTMCSHHHISLVSYFIAASSDSSYSKVILKLKEKFNFMKKSFPESSYGEDCLFAALFALADTSESRIASSFKECYEFVSKQLPISSVKSLAFVASLSEKPIRFLTDSVSALEYEFFTKGCGVQRNGHILSFLAALSLIDAPHDEIADKVYKAYRDLKNGDNTVYSPDNAQILSLAAWQTLCEYIPEDTAFSDTEIVPKVEKLLLMSNALIAFSVSSEIAMLY